MGASGTRANGGQVTRLRVGRHEYVIVSVPVDERTDGAAARDPRTAQLTQAERDVEALLVAGHSNAAIARRRNTSARTVANQVASVFAKRGVRGRSELIALLAREPAR